MDTKQQLINDIKQLKQEKNAAILAHYYVDDDVQDVADYIGDSFYLSKLATTISETTIVLCGVSFMGESVKILNPSKTVLLPDDTADCPMAHMADEEKIKKVRQLFTDVAVVCYINSTAALKTLSDVCVTSANAVSIVSKLPQKNIYFIPDQNLAHYVASKVPDKNFIYNDGFCPIHNKITANDIIKVKSEHPDAPVLMHPECTGEVLAYADYIGSTSGIIKYVAEHSADTFIICTEEGVMHELKTNNPGKTFVSAAPHFECADMKKITLRKVYESLKDDKHIVSVDDSVRSKALLPLEQMLNLAK